MQKSVPSVSFVFEALYSQTAHPMTYVRDSLAKMPGLSKPRRKFVEFILTLLLALPGRATFRNMSRYGPYSEKTFSRQFAQAFDFLHFNRILLADKLERVDHMLAIDASFVSKSGKKTYGIDKFFSSTSGRAEKGLEISLVALVDTEAGNAYSLQARQTPCFNATEKATKQQRRMRFYQSQLARVYQSLPVKPRYIAADGHYAKTSFFDASRSLGLHVIIRLRSDSNARLLFEGPHPKRRGPKKKYAEKVDWKSPLQLEFVAMIEEDLLLYTQVVNSPRFKRNLRTVYLFEPITGRYVILASTDLEIDPIELVRLYRLRFQIEFLFRDSKQHTGLMHCQARDKAKLDFHFNASLAALNVAKLEHEATGREVFSMASRKRISFNELYLDRIIEYLDLAPEFVKLHPAYEKLRHYGAIAA